MLCPCHRGMRDKNERINHLRETLKVLSHQNGMTTTTNYDTKLTKLRSNLTSIENSTGEDHVMINKPSNEQHRKPSFQNSIPQVILNSL